MMTAPMQKLRGWAHTLFTSNASPREVSEALALGVFIGITPTVGLHTWLALGLAFLFKKNKIATLIGAYITNPLTFIPIYYSSFRLGKWLLQYEEPAAFSKELLLSPFSLGTKILVPLWAGCLAIAIPATLLTYYISLYCYEKIRKKFSLLDAG